ncbi:hypothetical protein H8B06_02545 [Sphingobacterium sp. DN00404]|uniref:PH domain-containing protein n=1 Tax=Sphingobacterium micropteri TaxID=2763501 RepID=A0ABR7YKC8_9SPHI|nr:hypothetical protein [Sphingobacterium micropteri]MBD1431691.1 hypothetical protein [Sphingobacterium micropteri]
MKSAKSWLFVLILLIGVAYLSIRYLGIESKESLWILIPAILLTVFPGMVVQLWYTQKSRGTTIELEDSQLTYSKDDYSVIYTYNDIEIIMCNKTASYNTGRYTAGLERFWNLQVFTNDGQTFFITCLMYSDLDELIAFFSEKRIDIKVNNGSIGFKNSKPTNELK